MTAVISVLFEITVYSAALYGAILLFQKIFRRHISAALNYAVWALLILRLLMPVTIDSGLHLFVLPEEPKQIVQSELSGSGYQQQRDNGAPVEESASNVSYTAQTGITSSSTFADNTQHRPEPWRIDWQTALVLLWGAGAAFSFVCTALIRRRLQKNIKRYGITPPAYILKLTDECKTEMGIKADINVSMHFWLKSPALSVCLKPALLLPLRMSDTRQLELAIRHELTHYRRRDHLANILLIVLRCVYWFNPVVYLALYRIQSDMETACDASITSLMKGSERIDYIRTIIDLSGSGAVQCTLGMGMCKGRKAMEKRVRAMFMKKKTKLSVRLAAALLAAITFIAFFTTACQPTPHNAVIVNKNDGRFEEKLRESPRPPESYKALEHWSETVQEDKLKIVIDTNVLVPDADNYPVVKLERAAFTQQRVDELVSYFAQGKQLHLPHVMTKADYEEWIVAAKRGELIDGKYVITDWSLNDVKDLEKKKAAAPEDSPVISTDTTLTYDKDCQLQTDILKSGKNFLRVAFDNGNGDDALINIDNYTRGYNRATYFSYSAGGSVLCITESMYQEMLDFGETEEECGWTGAGVLFDKVEVTREGAIAEADKVINGLGIKHVMLVNAEKYVDPGAPEKNGYVVEYARQSGGIPVYWFDGGGWHGSEEPPAYSPPFTEEALTAQVSKEGLVSLQWRGCASVVETVNENVELMPFKTIQQMLKDRITYKNSFMREDLYRDLTVTVTSAELRMGYIGVKNNVEQALMVPAWVFETSISYYDINSGTQQSYKDNTYVLNALDGGAIEYRGQPVEYISP